MFGRRIKKSTALLWIATAILVIGMSVMWITTVNEGERFTTKQPPKEAVPYD
jgi:hypothetical protein